YDSQVCSGCGRLVRKSLAVRTHICPRCGLILDRDHNAVVVIREARLAQAIQHGVWDPTTQRVLWRGSGNDLGSGSNLESGTMGHTGTERLGTARLLWSAARRFVAPADRTKHLPAQAGQSVKTRLAGLPKANGD